MKEPLKVGLLLVLFCVTTVTAVAQESEYLLYDAFIRQLDAGNIRSVQLDDTAQVHGVYVVNGEERVFRSYSGRGAASDPLLIRELERQGVDMVIEERPIEFPNLVWGLGGLWMLIMYGIPLITLIYIARVNKKVNMLIKNMKNTSL